MREGGRRETVSNSQAHPGATKRPPLDCVVPPSRQRAPAGAVPCDPGYCTPRHPAQQPSGRQAGTSAPERGAGCRTPHGSALRGMRPTVHDKWGAFFPPGGPSHPCPPEYERACAPLRLRFVPSAIMSRHCAIARRSAPPLSPASAGGRRRGSGAAGRRGSGGGGQRRLCQSVGHADELWDLCGTKLGPSASCAQTLPSPQRLRPLFSSS